MRSHHLVLAGSLTLGLTLLAPTGAAFHGGPYLAEGTATLIEGTTITTFQATVTYGGWWNPSFHVLLKDPVGNIVVDSAFAGQEALNLGVPLLVPCGASTAPAEIVAPYWAQDLDPAVTFDLWGFQFLDGCSNTVRMHYEGWYNEYLLDLDVWQPL